MEKTPVNLSEFSRRDVRQMRYDYLTKAFPFDTDFITKRLDDSVNEEAKDCLVSLKLKSDEIRKLFSLLSPFCSVMKHGNFEDGKAEDTHKNSNDTMVLIYDSSAAPSNFKLSVHYKVSEQFKQDIHFEVANGTASENKFGMLTVNVNEFISVLKVAKNNVIASNQPFCSMDFYENGIQFESLKPASTKLTERTFIPTINLDGDMSVNYDYALEAQQAASRNVKNLFVGFTIPNDYIHYLTELTSAARATGIVHNDSHDCEIIVFPEDDEVKKDDDGLEYQFLNLRIFDVGTREDMYVVRLPHKLLNKNGDHDFDVQWGEDSEGKACMVYISMKNFVRIFDEIRDNSEYYRGIKYFLDPFLKIGQKVTKFSYPITFTTMTPMIQTRVLTRKRNKLLNQTI